MKIQLLKERKNITTQVLKKKTGSKNEDRKRIWRILLVITMNNYSTTSCPFLLQVEIFLDNLAIEIKHAIVISKKMV